MPPTGCWMNRGKSCAITAAAPPAGAIPIPPKCYREGEAFCGFSIKGKTLGLMVCGDFYTDSLIKELQAMEDRVDAFLWPVHCDYPLEEWEGGILEEYREHSRMLQKPVLFVNNLHPEESRARGGAYQWHKGQTLAHCPAGKAGMVVVKL
jgi:hypothetical protein